MKMHVNWRGEGGGWCKTKKPSVGGGGGMNIFWNCIFHQASLRPIFCASLQMFKNKICYVGYQTSLCIYIMCPHLDTANGNYTCIPWGKPEANIT